MGTIEIIDSLRQRVERAVDTEAQRDEALRDPVWRIFHLYRIVDKDGKVVAFTPNLPQQMILEGVYVRGERRILILKARQLGFSTLIALIAFDEAFWKDNMQCSIVDQSADSAAKKLDKCRFAFEGLSEFRQFAGIEAALGPDNGNEMGWLNGSTIIAGLKARGGTNHFLHISEWGPIAYADAKRSKEIKTGALPSAERGLIFIESTFMGNKVGDFYELIEAAASVSPENRTEKDFVLYFFAWWEDPAYTLDGNADQIDPATVQYLDEVERKIGHKLTAGQRLWYFKTKQEQRLDMQQEYPSTMDEALTSQVKGAIYGAEMALARKQGRIRKLPYDRSLPVHTAWDIGGSDWTVIWFFQIKKGEVYVIDYYRSNAAPPMHYAQVLRDRGYNYVTHLLPHDADHKKDLDMSWRGALEKAGIPSSLIRIVPRVPDIWLGIGDVVNLLPRCHFDAENCDEGIRALESYRTDVEAKTVRPTPVHDAASHPSDAFRTLAQGFQQGLLLDMEVLVRRPRGRRNEQEVAEWH